MHHDEGSISTKDTLFSFIKLNRYMEQENRIVARLWQDHRGMKVNKRTPLPKFNRTMDGHDSEGEERTQKHGYPSQPENIMYLTVDHHITSKAAS